MREYLNLLLSLSLLFVFTACTVDSTQKPSPSPTQTPTPSPVSISDYQKYEVENGVPKDKFDISFFFGPTDVEYTEDMVKLTAECGFTSVPLAISLNSDINQDYQTRANVLKLLAKYGLTCSDLCINYESVRYPVDRFDAEKFENTVKNILEAIKDCDNVKGWNLCDEPTLEYFDAIGQANEILRRIDPNRTSFVNLFPTYATSEQLGTATYEEYLEKFIEIAKPFYLSFDNYQQYPYYTENGYSSLFTNLELVRRVALEHDLPYQNIILLTHHYGYPDLTRTQISWEACNSLVYGVKGLSYFTFSLSDYLISVEGWDDACINYKGEIYQHYYDVQSVNSWVLPLGTELFNKTSTAVFHCGDDNLELECTNYTGYGKLGEIYPINGRFVIGFFDDDSFMITNKDCSSDNLENFILLKDITPDQKLEYFDTTTATWRPANESESISLASAASCYIASIRQGSFIYLRIAE